MSWNMSYTRGELETIKQAALNNISRDFNKGFSVNNAGSSKLLHPGAADSIGFARALRVDEINKRYGFKSTQDEVRDIMNGKHGIDFSQKIPGIRKYVGVGNQTQY